MEEQTPLEAFRLVLGGTSNLARSAADFTPVVGGMDTVLEALEEDHRRVLARRSALALALAEAGGDPGTVPAASTGRVAFPTDYGIRCRTTPVICSTGSKYRAGFSSSSTD